MSRRKNEFTDTFVAAPFWVSLVIAFVSYFVLRGVIPAIEFRDPLIKGLANLGVNLAPLVAIFFVFLAIVSLTRSVRIKNQFKKQESVDTLNALSWKEFEDVTGEYFRRRGYSVEENLRHGADGGVDLRLRKDGLFTVVQCKRWIKQKVNLSVVRELLGAITAESADSAIWSQPHRSPVKLLPLPSNKA